MIFATGIGSSYNFLLSIAIISGDNHSAQKSPGLAQTRPPPVLPQMGRWNTYNFLNTFYCPICFRLWNQNHHSILYVYKKIISSFDFQLLPHVAWKGNLIPAIDFYSKAFNRRGVSLLKKFFFFQEIVEVASEIFFVHGVILTPLPSPLKGRGWNLPQTKRWLGKLNLITQKRRQKIPSPLGEGQVNMPIMTLVRERSIALLKNYLDREEVILHPTIAGCFRFFYSTIVFSLYSFSIASICFFVNFSIIPVVKL